MIQAYQVNLWRLKTRIKLAFVCILSLVPCKKKHLGALKKFFFLRNGFRFTAIGNNWKQLRMKTVTGVVTQAGVQNCFFVAHKLRMAFSFLNG